MRVNCRVWPGAHHPAFPKEVFHWAPLLNVRLVYQHSPPTKYFESWIDSGAHVCMFHADFCRSLGINLESGVRADLGGIVGGAKANLYFHKIKILVGSYQVTTMAGFSKEIAVGGLLGRRGFFDEFIVKIDSSTNPPYFEIDKINRT